jgi:hypothetical protein
MGGVLDEATPACATLDPAPLLAEPDTPCLSLSGVDLLRIPSPDGQRTAGYDQGVFQG